MQAFNFYGTNSPLGLEVLQDTDKNTKCFAAWYPATILTKNRSCGVWLKQEASVTTKKTDIQEIYLFFPIVNRQGGTDDAFTGLCMRLYIAYQNHLSGLGPH